MMATNRLLRTALCLFFLAPAIAVAAKSNPLVITHITVIDATGAPAAPDMTIVVTGDRISEIGKSDAIKVPKNANSFWNKMAHGLGRDRGARTG